MVYPTARATRAVLAFWLGIVLLGSLGASVGAGVDSGALLLDEPLPFENQDLNVDGGDLLERDFFEGLISSEEQSTSIMTPLSSSDPVPTTTQPLPSKTPPTATPSAVNFLQNSIPVRYVLSPGGAVRYRLENIKGPGENVYITLNVCGEPDDVTEANSYSSDGALSLFATDNNASREWPYTTTNLGFSNITLTNVSGSVDVAVAAPTARIKNRNAGNWTYEVAVSTKKPIHSASSLQFLNLVDTDFAHALLVTDFLGNTTELEKNITDFNMYVYAGEASAPGGAMFRLSESYCGISTGPALLNQNNALLSTTTRGQTEDEVRGQVFLPGLNISSTYVAYLTLPNNLTDSTVYGGEVFTGVNFTTKTETNCQLVYDMKFCDSIAYAVPGNASMFTPANLSTYYDNIAQEHYQNFSASLQQVSCNTSTDASYSVLRGCDDCDAAYKQWLCAVTAPRCTDWSKNETYLYPRPVDTSRNPLINQFLRPGKYKEILPCIDLCYGLVQDCPATFGFVCPQKRDAWGFSYGTLTDDGDVTCSYPGAIYYKSGATMNRLGWLVVFVGVIATLI